jgi:hypothetical protein
MRGTRLVGAVGFAWLCAASSHAAADRVHLTSGSVIEGKAVRQGDKVVIEVESGEIAVPADSVTQIESKESDVQHVDALLEKLAPGDVEGLLRVANFCRDHDMSARERAMLERVIEVVPDHAEARARLGYVRANSTWIKREDQLRAQGLVEYEGRWITPAAVAELERSRAQTEAAVHAREMARIEARRAEAEAERARMVAEASSAPAPYPTYAPYAAYTSYPTYSSPYVRYAAPYVRYSSPYASAPGTSPVRCARTRGGGCGEPPPTYTPSRAPFPIAGVRDPFDYFR